MFFSAKTFARKATVASLLSLMLASCVVVEDGPGPGPRPPRPDPGPQFCTREYDPVCARRGGGDYGWGGGGGGGSEEQFCTREYRPVCGRRGGALRTFPNACGADSAGYRVVDDQGPAEFFEQTPPGNLCREVHLSGVRTSFSLREWCSRRRHGDA